MESFSPEAGKKQEMVSRDRRQMFSKANGLALASCLLYLYTWATLCLFKNGLYVKPPNLWNEEGSKHDDCLNYGYNKKWAEMCQKHPDVIRIVEKKKSPVYVTSVCLKTSQAQSEQLGFFVVNSELIMHFIVIRLKRRRGHTRADYSWCDQIGETWKTGKLGRWTVINFTPKALSDSVEQISVESDFLKSLLFAWQQVAKIWWWNSYDAHINGS